MPVEIVEARYVTKGIRRPDPDRYGVRRCKQCGRELVHRYVVVHAIVTGIRSRVWVQAPHLSTFCKACAKKQPEPEIRATVTETACPRRKHR